MTVKIVRELATKFGVVNDKKSARETLQLMAKLKKAAVGLGAAFSLGQAVQAVRRLSEETRQLGDDLDKLSLKTGFSTDTIQELGFAADQQGVSFGTFANSLVVLQTRVAKAIKGNVEYARTFGQLGIDVFEARDNIEGAFLQIADAIVRVNDRGEQLRLLQSAIGDEGRDLVKLMLGGSQGIRELTALARKLGLVMSDELIDQSQKYTGEQAILQGAIRGVKNEISEELIPAMRRLNDVMFQFVSRNGVAIGGFIGGVIAPVVRQLASEFEVIGAMFDSFVDFVKFLDGTTEEWVALATIIGSVVAPAFTALLAVVTGVWDLVVSLFQFITGKKIQETFFGVAFFDPLREDLIEFVDNLNAFIDSVSASISNFFTPEGFKDFMFGQLEDLATLGGLLGPSESIESSSSVNNNVSSSRDLTLNSSINVVGSTNQVLADIVQNSFNSLSDFWRTSISGAAVAPELPQGLIR